MDIWGKPFPAQVTACGMALRWDSARPVPGAGGLCGWSVREPRWPEVGRHLDREGHTVRGVSTAHDQGKQQSCVTDSVPASERWRVYQVMKA